MCMFFFFVKVNCYYKGRIKKKFQLFMKFFICDFTCTKNG